MTSELPLVLALVPAWNAESFLDTTLNALAAQTYPNLKVIISNDASTDATGAICDVIAVHDDRFEVIHQVKNLGWVGNVNVLYQVAFAAKPLPKYVLTAFHDDVPEPTYIERCVEALEANPGASMAFTDLTLNWPDGHSEQIAHTAFDGVTDPYLRARSIALQEGDWWVPLRGVSRTSAAMISSGLRKHRAGEFGADWPWSLHMATLGELQRVPENLLTKNYRETSLSRSWNHFAIRPWLGLICSIQKVIWITPLPVSSKLKLAYPTTRLLRVRAPLRLREYGQAARQKVTQKLPGAPG